MAAPIIRFCWCGYPVRITGRWTGDDYVLLLTAGARDPDDLGHSLRLCPQCQTRLEVADLREVAPFPHHPSPIDTDTPFTPLRV